jgi:hypothetical protein
MLKPWLISAVMTIGIVVTADASKPQSLPRVPLTVTVDDIDSTGLPTQIRSDGFGPYVDGQDGVAASLDAYGDLIVDWQTRTSQARRVSFEYSRPHIPVGPPPPSHANGDVYLASIAEPALPRTPIQLMVAGSEQCVRLHWMSTLSDSNAQWRTSYRRPANGPVQDSSYAVVTRVDADTWEVEPKDAACNVDHLNGITPIPTVATVIRAAIKGQFVAVDYGTYYMPFKLTLRRR